MWGAAIILGVGLGTTAAGYTTDEGRIYELACNSSGYVLTPADPVVRLAEPGALREPLEPFQTQPIYLGRSCDAFSEVLGEGEWGWAAGGVRIDFADEVIGFPQQELSCPSPRAYEGACRFTRPVSR